MNMRSNISLKQYNTFRINAIAKYFAAFNSVEELRAILSFEKLSIVNYQSLIILGGGSNILFTKDVNGLVLKN